MAQVIEFVAPTGLTLTASVFGVGNETASDTQAATEETNRLGVYSVSVTVASLADGTRYDLIAFNAAGRPIVNWQVLIKPSGTFYAAESVTSANEQAILEDTGTTIPALITTVDTVVDTIQTTTDQFVFGNPNEVNANVVSSGGDVVVTGLTQDALAQFVTDDTGVAGSAGSQSVAEFSRGVSLAGPGSIEWEITVQSSGVAVPGVQCWVSTDALGVNIVSGTLYTNDFGKIFPMLDVGSYYLWRDSATHEFPSPVSFTVSA